MQNIYIGGSWIYLQKYIIVTLATIVFCNLNNICKKKRKEKNRNQDPTLLPILFLH